MKAEIDFVQLESDMRAWAESDEGKAALKESAERHRKATAHMRPGTFEYAREQRRLQASIRAWDDGPFI